MVPSRQQPHLALPRPSTADSVTVFGLVIPYSTSRSWSWLAPMETWKMDRNSAHSSTFQDNFLISRSNMFVSRTLFPASSGMSPGEGFGQVTDDSVVYSKRAVANASQEDSVIWQGTEIRKREKIVLLERMGAVFLKTSHQRTLYILFK